MTIDSNLDAYEKALEKAINRAGEIIGGMMESHAKVNITNQGAVDTGLLRNSITHGMEGGATSVSTYRASTGSGSGAYTGKIPDSNAGKPEIGTVVVGTNVEYAPYIELGTGKFAEGGNGRGVPWTWRDSKGKYHRTSGMKPRPYLRPAVEEHKDEYKDVLITELKGG